MISSDRPPEAAVNRRSRPWQNYCDVIQTRRDNPIREPPPAAASTDGVMSRGQGKDAGAALVCGLWTGRRAGWWFGKLGE
jgi:hypothetical protein